ncbi:sensor histidine kinase [Nocardiopsis sp. JB363]|uniref:sensor histidine kinase n=1 Tax=Nocardiopsis sp. JB363 TaxID=1434837 RepID=UPI00097A149F|nr:histidine kinase [Nocardiopsis sp. JB363]SIO90360.1 putative two-component system sensor kinase [Nocardiopsis sp. JB363]
MARTLRTGSPAPHAAAAFEVLRGLSTAWWHLLPLVVVLVGLLLRPIPRVGSAVLSRGERLARHQSAAECARVAFRSKEPSSPTPRIGDRAEPPPRARRCDRPIRHLGTLAAVELVSGTIMLTLLAVGFAAILVPVYALLPANGATFAGIELGALTIAGVVLAGACVCAFGAAIGGPLDRWSARTTLWAVLGTRTVRQQSRIFDLESARVDIIDAVEAERDSIARNLHDGAQQRLLAVAMAVSRANRQLERDPDKAVPLLAEAQEEAQAAIGELRQVARGAHPPILRERGLSAAVESIARRQDIQIRLDIDLAERPGRLCEASAYYVVAEALSNIVKHAGADVVDIAVWRFGDRLCLRITDDGVGGASIVAHHGLDGLRTRLRAMDGDLRVDSPHGGPTIVEGELPWRM